MLDIQGASIEGFHPLRKRKSALGLHTRVQHMLVSAGLGSWLIGQFDLDNVGELVRACQTHADGNPSTFLINKLKFNFSILEYLSNRA